jgi:flagellar protein FliL
MSKKKDAAAAAPEGEEAAKGGKSKKTMIIAVVGAIVLFMAGGKVMGKTKTVIKEVAPPSTTIPPGPVVTLDAITLNLADGHLLKVGMAFQLKNPDAEHGAAGGGGHGETAATEASSDSTKGYARAIDIAIDELGKHSMDDLAGAGRAAAKEELVARLEKAYHGEIEDVYFHQFVMQ